MLLLLLPPFILNDNTEYISCTLDDLFHIYTGVLDAPNYEYYVKDEGTNEEYPVQILRMGYFNPLRHGLKSLEEIQKIEKKNIELRSIRDNRKKNNKKDEIKVVRQILPDYKLLDENDYLINTRSANELPVTGYSLLEDFNDKIKNQFGHVSISHHFIIVKPRKTSINQSSVQFLHLLLDVFIDKYSNRITQDKSLLKTRDLKSTNVLFPKSLEFQKEILDKFNAIQSEIKKKEEEFELIKQGIADKLFYYNLMY
jgi:hypothetical protein